MTKKARKFNAYGVMLRRGTPCGPLHAEIITRIVEALGELGPQWYDHVIVPKHPPTFAPVPLSVPHFSPTPDVVVACRNHANELYMIHIQKVIPLKCGSKTKLPYYDRETEEKDEGKTNNPATNRVDTEASGSKHKRPKPGNSDR